MSAAVCLNVGGYALSWSPPSRTEIVIQFERQILFPMQIIFAVFFFAHFSMALETMRFSAVECGIISSPRSMRACVCVCGFFSGLCVTHANRGSVRPKIQTEKTHTGLMQMGRMYCVCVRTVGVRMCGKYATPGRLVFNRRHTAWVHGAHDVLGL